MKLRQTHPGPRPRQVSFDALTNMLPVNLQIGIFVVPICLIGSAFWFYFTLDFLALECIAVGVLMLPVLVILILRSRKTLAEGDVYEGLITKIEIPEDIAYRPSRHFYYSFCVDSIQMEHSILLPEAIELAVGDLVWVFADRVKPEKSRIWLDFEPRNRQDQ